MRKYSYFRVDYSLDEFAIAIISEKIKATGCKNLEDYFDLRMRHFINNTTHHKHPLKKQCRIQTKKFARNVTKKRIEFIQDLAITHNTTISSIIRTILISG